MRAATQRTMQHRSVFRGIDSYPCKHLRHLPGNISFFGKRQQALNDTGCDPLPLEVEFTSGDFCVQGRAVVVGIYQGLAGLVGCLTGQGGQFVPRRGVGGYQIVRPRLSL